MGKNRGGGRGGIRVKRGKGRNELCKGRVTKRTVREGRGIELGEAREAVMRGEGEGREGEKDGEDKRQERGWGGKGEGKRRERGGQIDDTGKEKSREDSRVKGKRGEREER